MSDAVVLLSGGIDSATALAEARRVCDIVTALNLSYGSLHGAQEQEAARRIARYYHVRYAKLHIPIDLFRSSGSALLGESDMPEKSYGELQDEQGPSPTVVPFRNAVLLSMAVAYAAARGIGNVYIGVHAEDAHNWAYPDCTPEFLGPFAAAVYLGTYREVRLRYPFVWHTKTDIVRRAAALSVPLGLTWSCYHPMAGGACGKCPTCIERIHAFEEAGFEDPIVYHPGAKRGGATIWPVSKT